MKIQIRQKHRHTASNIGTQIKDKKFKIKNLFKKNISLIVQKYFTLLTLYFFRDVETFLKNIVKEFDFDVTCEHIYTSIASGKTLCTVKSKIILIT